jgi:hypothetical protein
MSRAKCKHATPLRGTASTGSLGAARGSAQVGVYPRREIGGGGGGGGGGGVAAKYLLYGKITQIILMI